MKKNTYIYPLLGLVLCLTVLACKKSLSPVPQPAGQTPQDSTVTPIVKPDSTATQTPPYPQTPVSGCSYAPNYGDSIIYPQPVTSQDYIVSPVNNPGPGKYLSWPIGLVIDSLTGAIDVTKSETGMKYAIGFVKNGTTDTCLNILIIGGAAYMDSVYVLSDGATTAVPYFEANPYLPAVCSGGGCTFDVTGSAANLRVIVNQSTGVIDLKKTLDGSSLLGGAFGLIPLNGVTVNVPIYYRLNDPSNNALQHINVQLIYYYSKSQIGQGLLANVLTKLDNLLAGNLISTTSNPRPPLVYIVRIK
ncbi:MAG TPA: hypothetical protein VNS58_06550 [Puia sp.]|nr:hypothetical protein [Puia sp.]